MTDNDILISDLNDISEILNNNGYGGWCVTIRKAVSLLKEQKDKIRQLQLALNIMNGNGIVVQNGENNKHIVNHGTMTMTFGKKG